MHQQGGLPAQRQHQHRSTTAHRAPAPAEAAGEGRGAFALELTFFRGSYSSLPPAFPSKGLHLEVGGEHSKRHNWLKTTLPANIGFPACRRAARCPGVIGAVVSLRRTGYICDSGSGNQSHADKAVIRDNSSQQPSASLSPQREKAGSSP